jgi:quinol monooxygenase YgiN
MVEMDILDINAAHFYIKEQSYMEENNGLLSYEYFLDDTQNSSEITLLDSYTNESAHTSHHNNLRFEAFSATFTNIKLQIFGNPSQSVIDRMEAS